MSIAVAIQKGSNVYVYDESNRVLYTKTGELHGYTGTTVNVRLGGTIYTYDERGATKFTHSA